MPVWLITGCSTGFGRELAREVLARGWNAAVTARDPAAIRDIVQGNEAQAIALQLDVTQPAQIASAVRDTVSRFGTIDVLVNNAGYGYCGAVEEASDTDIREVFETNFFGLVAMTRAVLPRMRAQGRGAIVNISSVGGRMAQPGSGFYSATKFAVEGLSDALRKEVCPLGLNVVVVEPGGFRTEFAGRSLRQSADSMDAYAATAGVRRTENISTHGRQPGDPARAARAIITALEAGTPPFRLVLGKSAVQRIGAEMDAQRREIDAWEELAHVHCSSQRH
jgi:NAD(P)-dependent dehydrogenase (short-subunit alcohol dehydrogenase family)